MHRTQIYFEETLFEVLKEEAKRMGLSVSAYIRETVRRDLQERRQRRTKKDLSEFAGLWKDRKVTIESIREKAWRR
ncbi:hypothetical protein [Hydrogenimonas sp.]